jgi:hypothetical protein
LRFTKYRKGDYIKEDGTGGVCSTHKGNKKCTQNFGHKPEGKRPLVRPRCRWKDNIGMYFREIGWEGVDWIYLDYDDFQWRIVNTVMNFLVSHNAGNFLTS